MDFVKLSEQRFTAKKFDVNKKIPRDDVEKLKTILQLSPSSVNSQPWVFLWGTSDNSKKRVRPAIADFNWNRIDTCSDFVVIAVRKGLDDKFQHTLLDQEIKDGRIANEEIAKECFESRKFFIDLRERSGQTLNWETKQAYIAMTALLYGAASLGIDSTPIEGFDENKMDKLLNLDNYCAFRPRRDLGLRRRRRPQPYSSEVSSGTEQDLLRSGQIPWLIFRINRLRPPF